MTIDPSLAVRLYGTDEPVPSPHLLKAGPLTAELEAGNLRYVRFNGVEVMRAISFILRDKDWGTYNPLIEDLRISEGDHRFQVEYNARTADAQQSFRYRSKITGEADGTLVFEAVGTPETDFLTNRTGFVVLHPIAEVAGETAELEHVDGRVLEARFPALIDPIQPMSQIRRIAHRAADGALRVDCLMEGDVYEMEDQRNWTDASYKTYVRPLALPWPYKLEMGSQIEQRITLRISGDYPSIEGDAPVHVSLKSGESRLPALGMGLDPDEVEGAQSVSDQISDIGVDYLICHYDPRRGHNRATLEAQVQTARKVGADLWLEAIIASVEGFQAEIANLGRLVEELGSPFSTVLVSPAADTKCTLPGSPWPPAPPAEVMYRAARQAFPHARLGGGMFSYFTELNRKRPPLEPLDLVSFTTSALVHAGDDRSVMETLQALPAIAQSAKTIAGPVPYAVGPSAIGMRDNPYGVAPKDNPKNIRQAMNRKDPRQRGLLGAAWALGYFARFAYGGAESIALGSLVGASGAVAVSSNEADPFFAEHGGVYPVFHVLRGLTRHKEARLRQIDISRPDLVQGLALSTEGQTKIWLANLTDRPIKLETDFAVSAVARLTASNFVETTRNRELLDHQEPKADQRLQLGPYEILRLNNVLSKN